MAEIKLRDIRFKLKKSSDWYKDGYGDVELKLPSELSLEHPKYGGFAWVSLNELEIIIPKKKKNNKLNMHKKDKIAIQTNKKRNSR